MELKQLLAATQVKAAKLAAIQEEKEFADRMQKEDEQMQKEMQKLKAKEAAQKVQIEKSKAERMVRHFRQILIWQ